MKYVERKHVSAPNTPDFTDTINLSEAAIELGVDIGAVEVLIEWGHIKSKNYRRVFGNTVFAIEENDSLLDAAQAEADKRFTEKPWLSTAEAARWLTEAGFKTRKEIVYKWAVQGRIPSKKEKLGDREKHLIAREHLPLLLAMPRATGNYSFWSLQKRFGMTAERLQYVLSVVGIEESYKDSKARYYNREDVDAAEDEIRAIPKRKKGEASDESRKWAYAGNRKGGE